MTITREIARFATELKYEDLPLEVVNEIKRLMLDSLGCALGGLRTEKGKIAVRLARCLGGPSEATIVGTMDKVSVAASSFATGELINALDYEALLSPPDHATPYVMAAPLAIGEMKGISGKELIVAIALAHELATRIGSSLIFGNRFAVELPEREMVMSLPTPGYGLCAFGGVAGAGRLLGLNAERMAHAMGIAGYTAPVPMLMKFAFTLPSSMSKYLAAGFLSQAEVIAVLLAEMGYTGDKEVLEGNYGFWRGFGCDGWMPESITEGLGEKWYFPYRIFYKTFPCCGAMQNALAHFQKIIIENGLQPDEIGEVRVRLNPLAELPLWRTTQIETHIEAQFSVPYVFAVMAHGIEIGPSWQAQETFRDSKIIEFMRRVKILTAMDGDARERPDVEVMVHKGATRKVYSQRGLALRDKMTDAELIEKFKHNVRTLLEEERANKVIDDLQRLEDLPDISGLLQSGSY
ncbi:MAG: MmgE/PrpD family protein [Deltaproteobacteria bacterium]|nr:MmgE/PrpD family protein [Deltaproteobacteria bacterium]